ncbi:MAG: hypothetical protein Hyperionvirus10_23 [Hyperionvirus sp.]|uniref:Uncharacterized protein n=1 Tax=Hyperionvirus sp. TaxID=2487770 RepID=A0A3G5A8V1_9VIRU|nr:MAG: hypothetical protein Hyperionvirus10_23 [Hyperionvirus sp.]
MISSGSKCIIFTNVTLNEKPRLNNICWGVLTPSNWRCFAKLEAQIEQYVSLHNEKFIMSLRV